jgi:hypothetical protein
MFNKNSTHKAPVSRLKKFRYGAKLFKGMGPRKYLAYSAAFKKFVKTHPGVMSGAYKMIKEIKKTTTHNTMRNEKLNLTVEPITIYKHTNMFNRGLYKVKVGPTTFFVKDSTFEYSDTQRKVWENAHHWLKKQGSEINGLKIRLLTPHVVYNSFLVSNFYEGSHVIDVADMRGQKRELLDSTISQINDGLEKEGAHDCKPRNVFYDQKHNTLILFDLISKKHYDQQVEEAQRIDLIKMREGRL